jgi:hypothetical protein
MELDPGKRNAARRLGALGAGRHGGLAPRSATAAADIAALAVK